MSTTYLLRHGQTALSRRYVCSGNVEPPVPVDDVGKDKIHGAKAASGWLSSLRSVASSEFLRARQTAEILAGDQEIRAIEPRLNEINYGLFEGRPWMEYGAWLAQAGTGQVPPSGNESWDAAVDRMLDGLLACLELPGPRLVVCHGLLMSVVSALLTTDAPLEPTTLPEAPYVTPLVVTDTEVRAVLNRRSFVDYPRRS